jgi:hypothetical protein
VSEDHRDRLLLPPQRIGGNHRIALHILNSSSHAACIVSSKLFKAIGHPFHPRLNGAWLDLPTSTPSGSEIRQPHSAQSAVGDLRVGLRRSRPCHAGSLSWSFQPSAQAFDRSFTKFRHVRRKVILLTHWLRCIYQDEAERRSAGHRPTIGMIALPASFLHGLSVSPSRPIAEKPSAPTRHAFRRELQAGNNRGSGWHHPGSCINLRA